MAHATEYRNHNLARLVCIKRLESERELTERRIIAAQRRRSQVNPLYLHAQKVSTRILALGMGGSPWGDA